MSSVSLVHEHSWPSVQRGGERYLHDLGWYLHRHTQLEVSILTALGRPLSDRIEEVRVRRCWPFAFAPLGRWTRRFPRTTSALAASAGARALRRDLPSVVHAFSPNAALAARRLGVPTVFTTVGVPDAAYARRHPRRWAAIERAARAAEVVTAVGDAAASGFADAIGREVLGLPPGIRMDRFPPALQPRRGPPRVLFASTVTPRNKGFASVLDAFPRVVAEHPDARLVVLGPGDVAGHLARAGPAVRRLRDQIDHDVPAPAAVPAHYREGTVTVLPSTGEAFGLVLVESLAVGTPIVASTEGGPAEILAGQQGRIGHPATPHDPESIASAILATVELAGDPATPARCHDHANRWSLVDAIGPRHERLYRRIGG